MNERYYTLTDFAKKINKSRATAYNWHKKGILPCIINAEGICLVDYNAYKLNKQQEEKSMQKKLRNGISTIKRKYTAKDGTIHYYEYKKVTINKDSPTFYGYAKKFYETRQDISPTTKQKMLGILERKIKPTFEYVPASELTKDMLQDFINGSNVELKELMTILNQTCEELFINDYIPRNIAKLVKKPKYDKDGNRINRKKRELPTKAELDSFYDYMQNYNQSKAYVVQLMLATGICRGEALGLLKSDINFDNCSITINKSWNKGQGGKPYMGEVKNEYRKRTVWFPKELTPILKKGMANTKGKYFAGDKTGKQPIDPDNFNHRYFAEPKKKLGIHVRFSSHCARHIYITRAIMNGVPLIDIMHQVGHKDLTMICEVYSHYITDNKPSTELSNFMTKQSQDILSPKETKDHKKNTGNNIIHVDFKSKVS